MFKNIILSNNKIIQNNLKLNNFLILKNYSTKLSTKVNPKDDQRKVKDFLQNKVRDFNKENDKEKKMKYFEEFWKELPKNNFRDSYRDVVDFFYKFLETGNFEQSKIIFDKITQEKIIEMEKLKKKGEETFFRDREEGKRFNTMLYYYLNREEYEELEKFILANAPYYRSYFELQEHFKTFLKDISRKSFKQFSDLVYSLYENNVVSPKASVNILLFSIDFDPSGNTFKSFYQYHKNLWGLPSEGNMADILTFALIQRKIEISTILIDDISNHFDSYGNQVYVVAPKHIHHMMRLIYRSEKDPIQFNRITDKILNIASKQSTLDISTILYFYSTVLGTKDLSKEERVNDTTASRFNHDLLMLIQNDEKKLSIINTVILFLLSSDQYHKALAWYVSISNTFNLSVNYDSVINFKTYHKLLIDENKDIELNRQCLEFWDETIKKLDYPKQPNSYPEEIKYKEFKKKSIDVLAFVSNLSKFQRTFEMAQSLKESNTYHNSRLLDSQLKKLIVENQKTGVLGSEIFNILVNDYLSKNDLPSGALLIESIVSLKNHSSGYISKLENIPYPIVKPFLANKSDLSLQDLKQFYNDELINSFIAKPIEQQDETEIENFKKLLFNMFYYKFNSKMAMLGLINLIEKKQPINFDLLEQSVNTVSENKASLDREIIKISVFYSFVHKFTKRNNTYEDGFFLTLRHLADSRSFQKAIEYIEEFNNFKSLKQTLIEQSRIILEINNKDSTIQSQILNFLKNITQNGLYNNNLSFILNPLIKNLIVTLSQSQFSKFQSNVLLNEIYIDQLNNLDNFSISRLIHFNIKNREELSLILDRSLGSYTKHAITKKIIENPRISKEEIFSLLNQFRNINQDNIINLIDSISNQKKIK